MSTLLKKNKVRRKAEGLISRFLPSWVPFTPFFAQIEITNRCNLRCVMCPATELMSIRTPRDLSCEDFRFFVSHLPYLREVDLQGIGEPLLNPHLEKILEWCGTHNIEARFVTNGLLLRSERIKSLLKAGPSRITVSLDTVDPEVYANIRSGANVRKLLDNIAELILFRNQVKASKPHVGLMAITMKGTLEGMPDVIQTAAELGVDSLTIKGLNTMINPDLQERNLGSSLQRIRKVAEHHPNLEVIIDCEGNSGQLRCRWPWLATYVTVEGDVTPCCNCPDARHVHFGNLFNTPFRSVWNSAAYKKFRHELKTEFPQICRSCPDY